MKLLVPSTPLIPDCYILLVRKVCYQDGCVGQTEVVFLAREISCEEPKSILASGEGASLKGLCRFSFSIGGCILTSIALSPTPGHCQLRRSPREAARTKRQYIFSRESVGVVSIIFSRKSVGVVSIYSVGSL